MDTSNNSVVLRTLRHLDLNGPTPSAMLAEVLNVNIETLTDILRDGVRQRFLGREFDEDNGYVVYTIAARGRNALADENAANAPKPQTKEQVLIARIDELESELRLAANALHAANSLLVELVDYESAPQIYMVSVDHQEAPRKEHTTEQEARDEALRLSKQFSEATIRVLAVVDALRVRSSETTTATWASAEKALNEAIYRNGSKEAS